MANRDILITCAKFNISDCRPAHTLWTLDYHQPDLDVAPIWHSMDRIRDLNFEYNNEVTDW